MSEQVLTNDPKYMAYPEIEYMIKVTNQTKKICP